MSKETREKEERKAKAKAKAWYRDKSLVTKPERIAYKAPSAVVEIGQLVAIEYASDKFDGTMRTYRHDVTMVRRICISPDGSTIVVDPPLRVTTRGIEG